MNVECDTTKGQLDIKITPRKAPLGADRFLELVQDGFYNGTPLYRVVPGFVVQFGLYPGFPNPFPAIDDDAPNGLLLPVERLCPFDFHSPAVLAFHLGVVCSCDVELSFAQSRHGTNATQNRKLHHIIIGDRFKRGMLSFAGSGELIRTKPHTRARTVSSIEMLMNTDNCF